MVRKKKKEHGSLPELEALQTSHFIGWFNTFLHAYTNLSNRFRPCSIDSSLRLYDISVYWISIRVKPRHKDGSEHTPPGLGSPVTFDAVRFSLKSGAFIRLSIKVEIEKSLSKGEELSHGCFAF